MKKNMLSLVLSASLLLIVSFAFKKPADCSKVRNGKFYYITKINNDEIEIDRHDTVQIETNKRNGKILKNKIFWRNDCSFDLYINALSDSKLNKMDSLIATIPAYVEITSVNSKFYVCKWKMTILNNTMEDSDTMYYKKAP